MKDTMTTYTGKRIAPLVLKTEDVDINDIAHALSLLCRGGGHLDRFYSVAQHSINCAKEAEARGHNKKVILSCLLHDASEAYIADIIRPVKKELGNYLDIENYIMDIIFKKYGLHNLNPEEKNLWKQIDDEILSYELKTMMKGHEDRITVPFKSRPNFKTEDFKKVESEFLSIFDSLI